MAGAAHVLIQSRSVPLRAIRLTATIDYGPIRPKRLLRATAPLIRARRHHSVFATSESRLDLLDAAYAGDALGGMCTN